MGHHRLKEVPDPPDPGFLSPLGAEALSVQSGFALFTGLISAVFVLLPRAAADILAPASAAPIASAAIPR